MLEKRARQILVLVKDLVLYNTVQRVTTQLGSACHRGEGSLTPELLLGVSLVIIDEESATASLKALILLKQSQPMACIPILVLSPPKAQLAHWLAMGADDLITLPIDEELLAVRIQVWLTQVLKWQKALTAGPSTKPENIAYYNAGTGFSNYGGFVEELNRSFLATKRRGAILAVLNIVREPENITYENLTPLDLKKLTELFLAKLSKNVRKSDIIASLNHQETILVLQDIKKAEDAEIVINKILKSFSENLILNEKPIIFSLNIGVSIYPSDSDSVDSLLKNASLAMHLSKNQKKNTFQQGGSELSKKIKATNSKEKSFRNALMNNEFKLYYQPRVEVESGKVLGVEALVRWVTSTGDMLYPIDIIPLAEETGQIVSMTEWVLKTACRQVKMLHDKELLKVDVSVNIADSILRTADLSDSVQNALQKTGFPAKSLVLDFPEKSLLQDVTRTQKILSDLRALGVKVAVDNFGETVSALSYLPLFQMDYLKIGNVFVRNIVLAPEERDILKEMISAAHHVNAKVVAEYIETKEQLQLLQSMHCDEYQGYYFSKPVGIDDLVTLLKAHKTVTAS